MSDFSCREAVGRSLFLLRKPLVHLLVVVEGRSPSRTAHRSCTAHQSAASGRHVSEAWSHSPAEPSALEKAEHFAPAASAGMHVFRADQAIRADRARDDEIALARCAERAGRVTQALVFVSHQRPSVKQKPGVGLAVVVPRDESGTSTVPLRLLPTHGSPPSRMHRSRRPQWCRHKSPCVETAQSCSDVHARGQAGRAARREDVLAAGNDGRCRVAEIEQKFGPCAAVFSALRHPAPALGS